MTRKELLLRLQARLVARRDALRNALAGDWESHPRFTANYEVGDAVDAALDSAYDEISSRFAEIESREFEQVEHALERIAEGVYGLCEYCSQKISTTRLNALPYTNSCIDCQRDIERNGDRNRTEAGEKRWERTYGKPNLEECGNDVPIKVRDLEMELSDTP
jgi:DnaK suppressor protein